MGWGVEQKGRTGDKLRPFLFPWEHQHPETWWGREGGLAFQYQRVISSVLGEGEIIIRHSYPLHPSSSLGSPSDVSLPTSDAGLGVGYTWVLAPSLELLERWNKLGLETQGLFFRGQGGWDRQLRIGK